MSNADRIRVSMIPEVTFGITPASPVMQILPTTGQSLRARAGYQQSQTIRSDRNASDYIRLSRSASGGLPCELRYSNGIEALNAAIQATMGQAFSAPQSYSNCTTTPGAKTITALAVDFQVAVQVGDIIRTSGASNPLDNGYAKVTAVAALTLTVERDGDFIGSAGNVTVLRGARSTNGTVEFYYTIEVARLDLQKAQIFRGCAFNGMSLNIADGAITTANFDVFAKSSEWVDAISTDLFIAGATYVAPAINPVLDAIGVPEIRSGGVDYAAKSIALSLTNNLAPRTQVGSEATQSMRFGQFGATSQVSAYFDDYDDLQRYENNTATDLWWVMIDPAGKGYSISLPQVKFTEAGADTRGPNQDDFKELAVAAYLDPIELCTVRMQRWD